MLSEDHMQKCLSSRDRNGMLTTDQHSHQVRGSIEYLLACHGVE